MGGRYRTEPQCRQLCQTVRRAWRACSSRAWRLCCLIQFTEKVREKPSQTDYQSDVMSIFQHQLDCLHAVSQTCPLYFPPQTPRQYCCSTVLHNLTLKERDIQLFESNKLYKTLTCHRLVVYSWYSSHCFLFSHFLR